MFVAKGTSNYRSAIRQSRAVRTAAKDRFALADSMAATKSGGRERGSGYPYMDGVEHSVLQYDASAKRQLGHWYIFCTHEKALYQPCTSCHRSRQTATDNWQLLQRGEAKVMRLRD